jgi:hypothetical protein
MSGSEVQACIKRGQEAGLYNLQTVESKSGRSERVLTHGLLYVFPASPGLLVRGLPTSFAASVLRKRIRFDECQASGDAVA